MSRFLLRCLPCACLAMASTAQASVLEELSQSLLAGPTAELLADAYRSLPVSAQIPSTHLDEFAGTPSSASMGSAGRSPGFYLMPVGRPDEAGVGIGIRFPF